MPSLPRICFVSIVTPNTLYAGNITRFQLPTKSNIVAFSNRARYIRAWFFCSSFTEGDLTINARK